MTYNEDEANGLYDYVRALAKRYYPDYHLPEVYDDEGIQLDDESEPELEGYSKGIEIVEKIESGKAEFPFSREDYDNATAVLESLDAIGLDREKFWLALQFVYYWARSRNTNCFPMEPSVKERIVDLIDALKESRNVISIKRPGRAVVRLDDETRKYLIKMLEYGDAAYSRLRNPSYDGRLISLYEVPKDMKQKWWMMDMYYAFKFLFDKFCSDKGVPRTKSVKGLRNKDLLISRLLYLMRMTEDERYLDSVDPLHCVKKDCKRNPRPLMTSLSMNWQADRRLS